MKAINMEMYSDLKYYKEKKCSKHIMVSKKIFFLKVRKIYHQTHKLEKVVSRKKGKLDLQKKLRELEVQAS